MPFDPRIHHRRSIRKRGYDYAFPGWYFITVCTEGKDHTFGSVIEWQMRLNEAGRMVADFWNYMPQRFSGMVLDEFVVMPNHFHAIFQIAPRVVGAPVVGAPDRAGINSAPTGRHRAGTSPAPTVGNIVGTFKSLTANEYLRGVKGFGWRRLPKGLWQRNYYERIIRNERELVAMRAYIRENPARWDTDPENFMP